MGSKTKWIEGRPDDPSPKIARRALKSRLERMGYYLARAVDKSSVETENVHQLRVVARRTAAAIEIFDAYLPPGRARWLSKQVKRVRQAAGAARDFDVLLLRWTEHVRHVHSDEVALLLAEVNERRRDAQAPIQAVYQKLIDKRFKERVNKLLARIRWQGDEQTCDARLGCTARIALGKLVVPYLQAARAELTDPEALHAFRIQGKQVRYAMEVFAGAFGMEFRQELYPLVAALQDRLGAINDHVTARAYFEQWSAEAATCATRQALEMAIAQERQAFETSRQEFLVWWTAERRQDLERRFERYVDLDGGNEPAAHREAS